MINDDDLVSRKSSEETVSLGVYEQMKWERDVAISQLKELGIGFGQKIPDMIEIIRCNNCRYFMEYHSNIAKQIGKDGDCFMRIMHVDDNESSFIAVNKDDYCSYGELRMVMN